MTDHHDVQASIYFNANWQRYQESINKNMLYHKEMFAELDKVLTGHYKNTPFSILDIGCGDSSVIYPLLKNKPLNSYTGIDAAPDVLQLAVNNLVTLDCKKQFICEDMVTALSHITSPVDIIFTSYAVHHLSAEQKTDFIQNCKQKLTTQGMLLMIDGILEPGQTRAQWLDRLEHRFKTVLPDITQEELQKRMEHPRSNDFPESIESFKNRAIQQDWRDFQVLLDKGIFAFMAFYNS